MTEEDTVKLLRECNAGIRMGVSSIDEVLPKVKDGGLRQVLEKKPLCPWKTGGPDLCHAGPLWGRRQGTQPLGKGYGMDEGQRKTDLRGQRQCRGGFDHRRVRYGGKNP